MPSAELQKWIDERLTNGKTKEEVRDTLIKHGYSTKKADKALGLRKPIKIPIVPIIIVIAVVLAAAAGGYFLFRDNPFSECDKSNKPVFAMCVYRIAKTSDVSACDRLEQPEEYYCLAGYAAGHKDLAVCDRLRDEWPDALNSGSDWLRNCYVRAGTEPTVCERMTQDKQLCYYDAGEWMGTCAGVAAENLESCRYGLENTDFGPKCNQTDSEQQATCMQNLNSIMNDPTYCASQRDPYEKENCYQMKEILLHFIK